MKNITGKIFVLVASITTGFFITNNINIDKTKTNLSLNAVEYKNAVEERNNLYKELENIRSDNIDLKHSINKYEGNDPEKNKKLVEDMRNLLIDYGALSGIKDVTGRGVVLKIQDGDMDTLLDTNLDIARKLFHDNDIALVLNEIRNTSAEAIAINGHRILPNTGVICRWAFIGFEDDSDVWAPLYIYIIGDPEEIKASLLSENGYIQKLILRGIKIEIEIKEEITISKTNQITEAKYMQRVEGN